MTEYKKVFIDTALFIYFLEKSPLYFDKIKKYFAYCMDEGIQLVTSAVTVEEYLVHPYTKKENELIRNFKNFLEYMEIEVVSIDTEIAEQAARIRAEFIGFKAMDSLQIATAVMTGCEAFFTNDKQLRQEKSLPCLTMDDL